MRLVHLISGAAGMYCGSCLHSNTLAAALVRAGQDVTVLPLYTPIRTDEDDTTSGPIMFGGINVYLQQKWGLFRHTPWFLDRLLDRPGLLGKVSSRASSTRPEDLGELTVSMLRGEEGRQRKEVAKLVHWLGNHTPADVVHLSNALLIGVAHEIRRQLDVPVVCSLAGEDIFLERLPEPYYSQARDLLRRRAADLSALTAMNGYYADFMAEYLDVPRERIHVVPLGLKLEGHAVAPRDEAERSGPVTIGYLARICPEKGLHLLAEALKLLAADEELPPFWVRAAGYLGEADRPYLQAIQAELDSAGLAERFEYLGELDRAEKIAFLQSLDVACMPTVYRESKGLPVLEAWANCVPVVVPAHGAFVEMVEDTGGGLLCEPNDPASLAAELKRLIRDPPLAAECGRRAWHAVHDRYHDRGMAERMIALYHQVVGKARVGQEL